MKYDFEILDEVFQDSELYPEWFYLDEGKLMFNKADYTLKEKCGFVMIPEAGFVIEKERWIEELDKIHKKLVETTI